MIPGSGESKQQIRLLAVTRKPDMPSFRERIANNIELLRDRGIDVAIRVLPHPLSEQRRVIDEARDFDGVWWQRHLLSPLLLPRLRRSAKRLVFDFDDPIRWSSRGGGRRSLSRRFGFAAILRRADAVFAGSRYLEGLSRRYCERRYVIPMPVEVPDDVTPHEVTNGPVELFWFGSRVTQVYLDEIRSPLEAIGERGFEVRLRVVAPAPFALDRLSVDYRPWSRDEEDRALRECHIGLCPMPDTIWTRGKCPYKVLRYMSFAMPWVGSAVGENLVTAGVHDGVERGLCAGDETGWVEALSRLIGDAALRRDIGVRAYDYVNRHHRRETLADRQATAWREVLAAPRR